MGPSTVGRCAVSPDGVAGFHQPAPRRVSPARSILGGGVPGPMATWRLDGTPRTARQCAVGHNLPLADARRPAVLPAHVSEDVPPPRRPGAPVRPGPEPSKQWIHALFPCCWRPGAPAAMPPPASLAALAQRLGVFGADRATGHPARGGARTRRCRTHRRPGGPPCAHAGPERRLVRPTTLLHRPRVRAARTKPHRQACPARQCAAHPPLPQRSLWRPRA